MAPTSDAKGKDDSKVESTGPSPVRYSQLFRFADSIDIAMLIVGYAFAIAGGVISPISSLVLGELLNGVSNPAKFDEAINKLSGYLGLIGLGTLLCNFIGVALAVYSSERQARRLRIAYMQGVLRQDQTWYDTSRPGEASSRLSSDAINFQAGLGDKVCLMLNGAGQFVCGFVISFAVSPDSWRIALVLLAFVPAVAAVFGILFSLIQELEGGTDDAYARAGDVASEALSLIRTVGAYGGEQAELARYDKHLLTAEKAGYKKGLIGGINGGIFWVVLMVFYGVGLYAGARFIMLNREAHPECVLDPLGDVCFGGGEVVQSLFALISGAAALGFVFPNAKYVAGAQSAAARLYEVIDRIPAIDPLSSAGYVPVPGAFRGRIEFKDVTFAYPTRPEVHVLSAFSLTIEPGTTVALVGPSGSGKSTIVGLILRWYDPQAGQVLVDGVDVKDYNVSFLRAQMGLVNQEPQLLPGTISENILVGKVKTGADSSGAISVVTSSASASSSAFPAAAPTSEDVRDIESAARDANAYAFIRSLPQGFDTPVTGSQLSGGQKQRVAIARALIRDPSILLLDEATSALDTQSERIVQASIDRLLTKPTAGTDGVNGSTAAHASPVGKTRTTLMIAHRLSTVTRADVIVVLDGGRIVERGTHNNLLAAAAAAAAHEAKDGTTDAEPDASRVGLYAKLWELQRLSSGPSVPTAASTGSLENLSAASLPSPSSAAAEPSLVKNAGKKVTGDKAEGLDALTDSESVTVFGNPMREIKDKDNGSSAKDQNEKDAPSSATVKMDWARLWSYQKPEAAWVVLGAFTAVAGGCLLPGFSLVLANFFDIFYLPDSVELELKARNYLFLFLGIGAIAMGINMANGYTFGLFGERLIRRLRRAAFSAVIRQEIAYYDSTANSVGAITTRLGGDASMLRLVVGARLGDKVSSLATGIMGLIICFASSWKLAFLVIAVTPVFIACFVAENAVTLYSTEVAKKAYEGAGALASDATTAIRVVSAFGLQNAYMTRFVRMLEEPYQAGKKRSLAAGLGIGASNGFQAAVPGLVFWVGAQLMKNGEASFGDVLRVFFAFQFSTIGLQNVGSLASDLAQLASAFAGLTSIIDRPSAVDGSVGYDPTDKAFAPTKGAIEFKDVHFTYPSRPDHVVLKGLNLSIDPGTTVALVGPSGSGKSTIVQLLLRFYEPKGGSVSVDGRDLKDLSPAWLRGQAGWVQQEAPLFADSLAYNIAYGRAQADGGGKPLPDMGMPREAKEGSQVPASFVLDKDVEGAAIDANAAGFARDFSYHYATFVGTGGTQLSGGQKQRVAIARAIIRSPRILLLDEATSALDSESEALVQASIDRLLQQEGSDGAQGAGLHGQSDGFKRTTIIIAHRLATVKACDVIHVLDGGVVVESGSHSQLMGRADGLYRKLALAQDPQAA